MALPQDGQDANGLTKVTQIPAGKELMFIDPTTNEGGIITLEDLTKQILNGLLSQTFALDAGQKTIIQALNTLNSDRLKVIKATNKSDNNPETIDITNYSTYVFFLQHDGGTNYLLAVSMAQSAQKVAKIISSGDAFDITINNKNQVTFTSSEKYWTCVVVKLS